MYEDQEDFQQEYEDEYLKVTGPIRIIQAAVLALIPLGLSFFVFPKLFEEVKGIKITSELSLLLLLAIYFFNILMEWLTLHQKTRMPDKRKRMNFLIILLTIFILPVTDIVIYLSLTSM